MALKIKNTIRVFEIERQDKNITLTDPNPNMEPLDVMRFYSSEYPELTSANVSGPSMKEGNAVYKFQTIIGDKG